MRVGADPKYLACRRNRRKIHEDISIDVHFYVIWFRMYEVDTATENKT